MSKKIEHLIQSLTEKLSGRISETIVANGDVTIVVPANDYRSIAFFLRDDKTLRFEQLIDLTGIDFSTFAAKSQQSRFAVSCHLLSVSNNFRLRLRTFAVEDDFPLIHSLCDVWSSANWFEREAFDLFGIIFEGHPDLRRILTDYGFVGYPFRKDFPISGYVEMRYDQELGRVVYQPVTIEPRENIPRIVRDENYGNVGHG